MSKYPDKIWAYAGSFKLWREKYPEHATSTNPAEYIRADVAQAMVAKAREEREMFAWAMEAVAKAREDALREAAERIDRKIRAVQPEMTRRAQRLAENKKPGFQYALHRADLDARMSDRDMILALIDRTAEGDTNHDQ